MEPDAVQSGGVKPRLVGVEGRKPVDVVVKACEEALAAAKSGELRMVAIAMVHGLGADERTDYAIAASANTHRNLLRGTAAQMVAEWLVEE